MNKVSLIVPFYNEKDVLCLTVPQILTYMRKNFSEYEVIFVDDGSTDGSRALVKQLCPPAKGSRVIIIGYTNNIGRGQAIRFGMEHATGDMIGYIDCDLELKLEYVEKAFTLLKVYDIVIASKFVRGSTVHTPLVRRVSSRTYNAMIRLILRSKVQDHQAGLKFFRRAVASILLPLTHEKGWLWDTEMLYIAQKRNYSIFEMPITITYGFRKMRGSFVVDFLKLFGTLIRLKYALDKCITAPYNTTI